MGEVMESGVVWLDDGVQITVHRVVPGGFDGVWEL